MVAALMTASVMTVPVWTVSAADYEALLDVDFESGFAAEITAGSQSENSGWNLEWPPATDGTFHAKVEDSGLNDGSDNVLKMEQNALDDENNHQRIVKTFDDWGTADNPTYDGIFNYSFKVYVPSDVANGDKTFNQQAAGDTSIELIDSAETGQNELLTFYVTPKADNKVSFKHVYGTETGETGWETNGNETPYFNMDEWLTVNAVVDTHKGTYRFSVESESLDMPMSQEYRLRSLGGTRGGNGRLEGIRIQCWRTANNLLTYYDDISLTPEVLFADVIAEETDKLTLDSTENVIADFQLPETVGDYGATVTWKSSDSEVIAIDGDTAKVYPSDSQTLSATLTATVTLGNASDTKEFPITLGQISADEAALIAAHSKLSFHDIKGDNRMAKAVETDLQFISALDGVAIAWESSDNTVVNAQTGAVVRDCSDHDVILTATLTKGSEEPLKKEIPVQVIQNGTVIVADDFDWDTDYTTADATEDTYAFGDTGWKTVGNTNNEISVENSTIRVQGDTVKSGKALQLERRASTATGNHEIGYNFKEKKDLTHNKVIVEGSFKMTGTGRLTIRMFAMTYKPQIELNIDPRKAQGQIWAPMQKANASEFGEVTPIGDSAAPASGEWFDLRLELDSAHEKYDIFINGVKINEDIVTFRFVNNTESSRAKEVEDIAFYSARNDGSFSQDNPYTVFIDDVVIRTADVDYSVTAPVYTGSDGVSNATGPVAGGSLISVNVAKIADDAADATLFAAVYDGSGNLAAVKPVAVTEGTVAVSLNIPDVANPYLRMYVWEDGFNPVATIFDSRAYTTVDNSPAA